MLVQSTPKNGQQARYYKKFSMISIRLRQGIPVFISAAYLVIGVLWLLFIRPGSVVAGDWFFLAITTCVLFMALLAYDGHVMGLLRRTSLERDELQSALGETSNLLEMSPELIMVVTADSTCLKIAGTTVSVLGRPEAAIMGQKLVQMVFVADRGRFERMLMDASTGRNYSRAEVRMVRGDSTTVLIGWTARAADPSGRIYCYGHEVSEMETGETPAGDLAPAALAQLYGQVLHRMPIGLSLLRLEDPDNPFSLWIVMMNRVATSIGNYSSDEVAGKYITEVAPGITDTMFPQIYADLANRGGMIDFGEVRYGDERHPESIYASRAIGLPGRFVAVVFEDISRRKEMEQELQNLNAELEQRVAIRTAELASANALLEAERMRLLQAQRIASLGHWDWNLETGEQIWSSQAYLILGIDADQQKLNFDCYYRYVHPDDKARVRNQLGEAMRRETMGPAIMEHRIITESGEERVVLLHGETTFNEEGHPKRFSGAVQDITERKRTYDALRQSEHRFEQAFQQSPIPIDITAAENGLFIDVNEAFTKLVGYGRAQLIGKSGKDMGIWKDADDHKKIADLLDRIGTVRDFETRWVRHDGEVIEVLLSAQAIHVQDQICHLVQVRDITERKRAERALQESEQRFERAFQLSPIPRAMTAVGDGRVIAVNDACLRLFGMTRSEMVGHSAQELGLWRNPADREKLLDQIGKQGLVTDFETAVMTRDGVRDVLLSAHVIESSKARYFLVEVRDITDRKRAELALRHSEHRFATAFQSNPLGNLVSSLEDGTYLDVNQAFLNITGYKREELVGQSSLELGMWADPEQRRELVDILNTQERVQGFEMQLRTRNGSLRDMLVYAELIELDGKRCVLTLLQDVTEIRRAEEALRQSEQRFAKSFQHSPIPRTISTLKEGIIIAANDAFLQLTGAEREEVIGKSSRELGIWDAPEIRDRLVELLQRDGTVSEMEITGHTRGGELRHVLLSAQIIAISGEKYILAEMLDITERKRAEHQLRLAAATVQHMEEAVAVSDRSGHIVSINPAFTRVTGYTAPEAIGRSLHELLHEPSGRHETSFFLQMAEQLAEGDGVWEGEVWTRHKNGDVFPVRLAISTVRDGGRNVISHVAVLNGMLHDEQIAAQMEFIAYHDPLTSLPNRKLLNERCTQTILRARRAGGECALLLLDLNDLSEFNAAHGHAAGDKLLQLSAQRIAGSVRATDTVARLGGDEFAVLLDGLGGRQDAITVAQKLIAILERPFSVGGKELAISVNGGIAVWPLHGDSTEELLSSAREALLVARQSGPNEYRMNG